MSDLEKPFRVLVIGGGKSFMHCPAGLLTAQALKKRDIHSTVFEQDAALDARPRDWNFGIYWAQVPLGDCLSEELSKQVIEQGQVDNRPLNPNDVMPIFNGQTGDLLKAIPTPNSIRLHRRNFLRIVSQGIDIRYGKRLRSIESNGNTATAYFEDDTSETGNLIVGAEGAHSQVREFLVGKQTATLIKSPIVASVTMAKLPKEAAIAFQKINPRYKITFHPEGIFTWVGVHDAFADTRPGDWTFMIIQSWKAENDYDGEKFQGPTILADMKQRAKLFAEPFRSMFESIPDGTRCWHNQLSYWVPPEEPWDNRNSTVTMVGDAAHPLTFHRGQGLNNAIHDVAALAKLLSEKGTGIPKDGSESAVDAYEREMLERGREAVIGSNENSNLTHDWNTLLQSPLLKSGLSRPEANRAEPNGTGMKT